MLVYSITLILHVLLFGRSKCDTLESNVRNLENISSSKSVLVCRRFR